MSFALLLKSNTFITQSRLLEFVSTLASLVPTIFSLRLDVSSSVAMNVVQVLMLVVIRFK